MSEIKRWLVDGNGNNYPSVDGPFVLHSDHEAEVARLRAEVEGLRKDAEKLAKARELVRITRNSVSDSYEVACRNGDERAQSVCNARTSLLNNIDAAMGDSA